MKIYWTPISPDLTWLVWMSRRTFAKLRPVLTRTNPCTFYQSRTQQKPNHGHIIHVIRHISARRRSNTQSLNFAPDPSDVVLQTQSTSADRSSFRDFVIKSILLVKMCIYYKFWCKSNFWFITATIYKVLMEFKYFESFLVIGPGSGQDDKS